MIEFDMNEDFKGIPQFPNIHLKQKSFEDQEEIKWNISKNFPVQYQFLNKENLNKLLKYKSQLSNHFLNEEPKTNTIKEEEKIQKQEEKTQIKNSDEEDMFNSDSDSSKEDEEDLVNLNPYQIKLAKRTDHLNSEEEKDEVLKNEMVQIKDLLIKEKKKVEKEYYMECFPDLQEQIIFHGRNPNRKKRGKNYKQEFERIQRINDKKKESK